MQYTALPRDKGPGVLVLAEARWTIGMGAITRVLCVRKEKENTEREMGDRERERERSTGIKSSRGQSNEESQLIT